MATAAKKPVAKKATTPIKATKEKAVTVKKVKAAKDEVVTEKKETPVAPVVKAKEKVVTPKAIKKPEPEKKKTISVMALLDQMNNKINDSFR